MTDTVEVVEQERPLDMRDRVLALQSALVQMPQYEPVTEHYFHGGMYCRKMFSHADVTMVGKVHKKEHFFMVVSGTAAITTDDGVQVITGPQLFCSKPDTKRVVYSVTDVIYMTVHRTDNMTVESVEEELVEHDPTSMFTVGNKLKSEVLK